MLNTLKYVKYYNKYYLFTLKVVIITMIGVSTWHCTVHLYSNVNLAVSVEVFCRYD